MSTEENRMLVHRFFEELCLLLFPSKLFLSPLNLTLIGYALWRPLVCAWRMFIVAASGPSWG